MIPIAKPIVGTEEIEAVREVLESGMLAEGDVSRKLEQEFSSYIGVKHASVATNGTAALITALEAMDIQPGDEVITTPFTFIASANSIALVGGVPVFVDIDPTTYNLDPDLIEDAITERTKAIMPVHIFGMPCDMKRILAIAEDYDLMVIEDACQAHGATIDSKRVGAFGDIAAFSFYATKNMMTGEGGMIVTDNEDLMDRVLMIKNHGRGKEGGYSHYRVGYNHRMMDLVSAIGREQLKRLPGIFKSRRKNAELYHKVFSGFDEITPQKEPDNFESAYHVYAPCLESEKLTRDEMITELKNAGVASRSVYGLPCHLQRTYRRIDNWRWAEYVDYPDYESFNLPHSVAVGNDHFEVPIHPGVKKADIEHVGEVIESILA
ncbi:MAG: DegT/DnrJ/EryC1/StrS family aminotransferase [Promethearchaeati archaeon]